MKSKEQVFDELFEMLAHLREWFHKYGAWTQQAQDNHDKVCLVPDCILREKVSG